MGCFPEDELTFEGSNVEFKNHTREWGTGLLTTRGISTAAGSQTDSTRRVLEVTRVRDTVYVQLVGPQSSTDRTVNFTVRSTSTAVHGSHYSFNASNAYDAASSTGSVTVPANSSVGYLILDLNVNPAALALGALVRVDVDLTGSAEIAPLLNYDVFKVTIRGQ